MASPNGPLRRGWTTGACATAAAKAAATALLCGVFPDPVTIRLPRGQQPAFALATTRRDGARATAGVVKDAGDDPDVTHGALVLATVRLLPAGTGLRFRAGSGVGTVTRPGLPLPIGEPAVNPVPRQMIAEALRDLGVGDAEIEIAIPDGKRLAEKTLNGRLGIVGGLSILGTTGIVVPYSCAAWIDTIHRGIDVARASGLRHIAGATGAASEAAVRALHGLPDVALIEMGDFVGGMLKYLRRYPVPRVTIAGGVAKMTKLAQGMLDLHSRRGAADMDVLAAAAVAAGADEPLAARLRASGTVAEAFAHAAAAALPLGNALAAHAWQVAAQTLDQASTELEVLLFDRTGTLVGRSAVAPADPALADPAAADDAAADPRAVSAPPAPSGYQPAGSQRGSLTGSASAAPVGHAPPARPGSLAGDAASASHGPAPAIPRADAVAGDPSSASHGHAPLAPRNRRS